MNGVRNIICVAASCFLFCVLLRHKSKNIADSSIVVFIIFNKKGNVSTNFSE
jgi:hypothetical protein